MTTKSSSCPNTEGMKNEILIQRRSRYWYDRCLELAGARLVEFGSPDGATADDLAKAIGPKTAAVHCLVQEEAIDPAELPLEEVIRVAGEAGVPVTVDAAGQIYPLENIGKYVRMGAAFQCVAAKYIGAPQSTGLALGSEEMIRKLSLQTFASYEGRRVRGVGRPQKVDRQEVLGAVAAVKRWMSLNHEDRLADYEHRSRLRPRLHGGPAGRGRGAHRKRRRPQRLRRPHPRRRGSDGRIAARGRRPAQGGRPAHLDARPRRARSGWDIHVFGLAPGQEAIVGERVAQELRG